MQYTISLIFLTFSFNLCIGQSSVFRARVVDNNGKAVEFASVRYLEGAYTVSTNASGYFTIRLDGNAKTLSLNIAFIGKKTIEARYSVAALPESVVYKMEELSLTLSEVSVTPKFRQSDISNSSITFDKQAIEQVQAFSLMDVLNTLPGKATEAPNLFSPQTITFRSEATGLHNFNNSLGVGIIMDGIRLSNDANMQSRSVSQWGLGSSILDGHRSSGRFDVPFQGIDLREIPVENIESVEIVQGVASARYGEITDGAIIIERQAGRTPFSVTTNINAGSTSTSVGKGLTLGKRAGALNLSVNYTNSNQDPRDKVRTYNRIAQNTMWTKHFGQHIRNTFSMDYNRRLDDVKQDPDDDSMQKTQSKSWGLNVSNRIRLTLQSGILQQLSLTANYSTGKQSTYRQWLLNGPPKAYANKDTTGVYEGRYIPGNYMATEHIIGAPENLGVNLHTDTRFTTGKLSHTVSLGGNYSYNNNGGKGIVLDPERPRWVNRAGQNVRPYDFELNPPLHNVGLFIEDNIRSQIVEKDLWLGIGLRYDMQNGYGSLQPRINARYQLAERWQLNASLGTFTKAPTLAHRYPSPTWLDIPLLDLYTGNADHSLYLVYTHKIIPDNSNMKPSRSTQLEVGLRYDGDYVNSSVFAYSKNSRDGFSSTREFQVLTLPVYDYHYEANQPITYFETGDFRQYGGVLGHYVIDNRLSSDNYGVELRIQSSKIESIQTSFTSSSTFNYSSFSSKGYELVSVTNSSSWVLGDESPLQAIYEAMSEKRWSTMTKMGSHTHLPKIGFVVSFNADIFWQSTSVRPEELRYPVAYINKKLEYIPIDNFDSENQYHQQMVRLGRDELVTRVPMVYGIVNMSVAKEIRKSIRLAITGYNVFNLLPEKSWENMAGETVIHRYNKRVGLTAGVSVKL